MANATLDIPNLWADHHVLAVRSLLTGIKGVNNINASAAKKQVSIEYDPTVVSLESLKDCLASAGYPLRED